MDKIKSQGMTLNTMCWRKLDQTYIAGMDTSETLSNDPEYGDVRTVSLALQTLDALMLEEFENEGGQVSWEHRVLDVEQDDSKVSIKVQTPDENEKTIEADYVVGCDGANSVVRKSLFGEDFPGFTWNQKQIVATNVSGRHAATRALLTMCRLTTTSGSLATMMRTLSFIPNIFTWRLSLITKDCGE